MRGFFLLYLAPAVTLLLSTPSPARAQAAVSEYNFDIEYKTVTKAGKPVRAMAVGGGIPAPLIEATEGDYLRVTFNNKMDVETSIHWHGVLLPADQDGVPGLNTRPIAPGTSFTFEFPVTHSGTYWYHSHTGLQEQRGVYGPIVFHSRQKPNRYDREYVVVFSDWTNTNPDRVMHNLKRDGDYYALQKDSVQSWARVLAAGSGAIRGRMRQAWSRMGPMDLSDVGYDAFLVNGLQRSNLGPAKPGERVLLRLVNAATSSYFNVEFAGGPMGIIAADGQPVKTIMVKRLRMAVAETYDVFVTLPEARAYELRATAVDGTGYSSAILGDGDVAYAPDLPRPNLLNMDMGGMDMGGMDMPIGEMDMGGMDMGGMDMPIGEMDMGTAGNGKTRPGMGGMDMGNMGPLRQVIPHMTDYAPLEAPVSTAFATSRPTREVLLELTGNMERYIWSFGGKTLSEADTIPIKKGEVVRFRLVNKTMMSHPLHLHGHFFRVLNGKGDLSPLKHTVDVPPMSEVTIEFAANEERDWFFHCHMLYHMKTGMARVVSYTGTSQATTGIISRLTSDRHWYGFADMAAQSNMATGRLWAVGGRNGASLEFDYNWKREYEVSARVSHNISRFFAVYAGASLEEGNGVDEKVGTAGITYMLPLLVEANLSLETNGDIHLELESDLQLTSRVNLAWHWDSENDYRVGLEYEITKGLSAVANYDSDFDFGAGMMVKF